MKRTAQIIHTLTNKIQALIRQLYDKDPKNETFTQEGMLNGSIIVQEYLDVGEYAIAIEHLLYMVYESEIPYPNEIIEELLNLANKYKIKNPYS